MRSRVHVGLCAAGVRSPRGAVPGVDAYVHCCLLPSGGLRGRAPVALAAVSHSGPAAIRARTPWSTTHSGCRRRGPSASYGSTAAPRAKERETARRNSRYAIRALAKHERQGQDMSSLRAQTVAEGAMDADDGLSALHRVRGHLREAGGHQHDTIRPPSGAATPLSAHREVVGGLTRRPAGDSPAASIRDARAAVVGVPDGRGPLRMRPGSSRCRARATRAQRARCARRSTNRWGASIADDGGTSYGHGRRRPQRSQPPQGVRHRILSANIKRPPRHATRVRRECHPGGIDPRESMYVRG